ncbi:MAG: hypothetical protein JNK48_28815 [Bryobacterales bacterium]|nr:hypothetical protein [Bryobacterales bacterium]
MRLGAAAIAFRFLLPALDLPSILGFSAGASAIEDLMLVFLENPHASGQNGEFAAAQLALLRSGQPWVLPLSVVAERAVATTLHIACRTLLAVGIGSSRSWPIAAAFAFFAVVDGIAMLCFRKGWGFGRPAVALRL